ncbi:flagellar hook-length control protein FliK [Paenibacillus sp. Marseille-Q4541]|uniref:flagellar hook-length control protein FliK n=1 Tax=Paenibacillus sp. Marseille-Q4541 TaxID=2831522 RepID=UPI001BADC70B|nr:flagellar hook-length control protein FliK [Paenibacillus sp. Marseille-Q4541]
MNIGQTLRGLLGDSKAASGSKQLELKEGQVVRANVVQVSADQKEAVLQIKGVQVRAALDTPLKAGDTALLQVGSPNKEGMIVMKPYEGTLASTSSGTMTDLLSSLKLNDTKENRQLLIAMQQSGIQLTKENVKSVQNIMTAKPENIEVSEWVNSASLAMQRGLPMTGTTVSGLHMALYGPPLDQLMSDLDGLLQKLFTDSSLLGNATKSDETNSGNRLPSWTSQIQGNPAMQDENLRGNAQLSEGKKGTTNATGVSQSHTGPSMEGKTIPPQAKVDIAMTMPGVTMKKTDDVTLTTAHSMVSGEQEEITGNIGKGSGNGALIGADKIHTQENATKLSGTLTLAATADGVERQEQAAKGVASSRGNEQLDQSAQANMKNREGEVGRSGIQASSIGVDAWGAEQLPARSAAAAGPELAQRVANLLRELQAATQTPLASENSASKAAAVPGTPQQGSGADAQPAPITQAPTSEDSWVGRVLKLLGAEHEQQVVRGTLLAPAHLEAAAAERADTLKGLLMQVEATAELPPALKETAGQLVQLLTGHQLLMNTDRTAPFAQMNWFIPMSGADGQMTANVQIQSRRGPRGELDASNCRIWFDLNMKQLGPTLIDMQVVGKVISLHIRTDNELSARIFENGRAQIGTLLESTGYQLSVYRSEVITRESSHHTQESVPSAKQILASYVPDTYKGVDMRV